jgi:hypothetical protein
MERFKTDNTMKDEFLKEKENLKRRMIRGEMAKAAVEAMGEGANRQVFEAWLKAETIWPKVENRNFNALKKVIEERESKMLQERSR